MSTPNDDAPDATHEALAALKLQALAAPEDVRVWAELIRVAQALGEHEAVVDGLTRLLAYVPGNAELLLLRAEAFRELEDSQAAMEDVSAVLEQAPDHVAALRERIELLEDDGDLESALIDLDQLVLLRPEDAAVLEDRAEKRLAMDQIALALQDFDALVALEPGAGNLRRRAEVLGNNGRYDEAADDLERAFARDGDATRNTIAWLGLAKAAMESRQLGVAVALLGRATAAVPTVAFLLMRAQLRTILGQPEEARADSAAAAALDPAESRRLMAQIYDDEEREEPGSADQVSLFSPETESQ